MNRIAFLHFLPRPFSVLVAATQSGKIGFFRVCIDPANTLKLIRRVFIDVEGGVAGLSVNPLTGIVSDIHILNNRGDLYLYRLYADCRSGGTGNWLRAAVLGASDGMVSNGALILGVLAANGSNPVLVGVSGLTAGSLSMALGEYMSVSSQRDSEEADIKLERKTHLMGADAQREEFHELVENFMAKGLCRETATLVAEELSAKDLESVIKIHLHEELGINTEELTEPWHAALASAIMFICGAFPPLLIVILIKERTAAIAGVCAVAVFFLTLFGAVGSYIGGGKVVVGAARVLIGGSMALAVTFGIALLFEH